MLHQVSCAAWVKDQRPALKVSASDSFSFDDFPWIARILDEKAPRITVKKGAQLGLTVGPGILRAVHNLWFHPELRGLLYLFPREDDISDFSRARFGPIIETNPGIRALVSDTNSIGLKRIGERNLYLRHAGADPAALMSIDVDRIVFDERDQMDDDRVELARYRLSSSKDPQEMSISTATLPNYGVDRDYQESDQNVWMIRCRAQACRAWTCLELTWPDCFRRVGERVFRACTKCGGEIHVRDGEWTATYPERSAKHAGYWPSQLMGSRPRQQPGFLLDAYEVAVRDGKLREFHNSALGMAYAEIDDVLTETLVLSFCEPNEPRKLLSHGPTAMGFDVGGKDFHWGVAERRSTNVLQLVAFGKATSEDEICDIWKKFNVQKGVVDGMAEQRAVTALKKRLPGLWDARYTSQKIDTRWEAREKRVTVNRSASLDDSHQALLKGRFRLPRADEKLRVELVPQLTNLARQVMMRGRDVKTPEVVWTCIGQKNDHHRHMANYLWLAADTLSVVEKPTHSDYRPRAILRGATSWMSR